MGDVFDDNISRQAEEQEALRSIYGEEWQQDFEGKSFSITFVEGALSLQLCVTLTDEYPNQGPPLFQILAPSLSRNEMIEITNLLQDIYLDNLGETVIYQWIEKSREWLQGINDRKDNILQTNHEHEQAVEDNDCPASLFCNYDTEKQISEDPYDGPSITHGDPIHFKKSTFQGHVAVVTCVNDVKKVLSKLLENKKVANATHNMNAYRIYREDVKSFSQDCDDDGETQAGGRLLHLLQIMDARNIFVIVSRWYGGVHLGPDRFRLINNAARQVIVKAGLLPPQDQKRKQ